MGGTPMEFFVSTLLFGISVGGQYALIAIGSVSYTHLTLPTNSRV